MALNKQLKFPLKNTLLSIVSLMLILIITTTTHSVSCEGQQQQEQREQQQLEDRQSKWTPIKDFRAGHVESQTTAPKIQSNFDTMKASSSAVKPVTGEATRWPMQADPLSQVVSQAQSSGEHKQAPSTTTNNQLEHFKPAFPASSHDTREPVPSSRGSPEPSASVMSAHLSRPMHPSMLEQPEAADEGEDYNEENANSNAQDNRYHGPGPMQLDSAGSNEGPIGHLGSMSHLHPGQSRGTGQTDSGGASDPEEEAMTAEQKEQEAAEASEAEAANQAALDEQQQQQRQIIMAQAQSEAKAIKEQQEALLRQQALQQQMLFKRYNDLNGNQTEQSADNPVVDRGQMSAGRTGGRNNRKHRPNKNKNRKYSDNNNRHDNDNDNENENNQYLPQNSQHRASNENNNNNGEDDYDRPAYRGQQLYEAASRQHVSNGDIQFSDQPDGRALNAALDNNIHDEIGDYSVRQPAITAPLAAQKQHQREEQKLHQEQDRPSKMGVKDLLTAAQHSYGSHYKSLKSHQKDYYQ